MNEAPACSTRRAASHTVVVFGGNLAATGLAFLTNILLMRTLGPHGFGVVLVATTFLTVLWQLAGRGLDQAMVRLLAMGASSPTRGREIMATVHQAKWLLGGLLALGGIASATPVTRFFLGRDVSPVPLQMAAVGAVAASLWGYTGACLQAQRAFGRLAGVQLANAGARLAAMAGLSAAGALTPASAMFATGAAYAAAAAWGYGLASSGSAGLRSRADLRPQLYRLSRWLVISSMVHLLYTRMDQLIVSRVIGAAAGGVYGAAMTFVQLVDLLTASLLTVFLPQICGAQGPDELRRQSRYAIAVSATLAVPVIPAALAAGPVLKLLLGEGFAAAAPVFAIVIPGAIFNIVTHPLQAVLHARARTGLLTWLDLWVLAANTAANCLAVGAYGLRGAAAVALGTRVLAGLVLLMLVARELSEARPVIPGAAEVRACP